MLWRQRRARAHRASHQSDRSTQNTTSFRDSGCASPVATRREEEPRSERNEVEHTAKSSTVEWSARSSSPLVQAVELGSTIQAGSVRRKSATSAPAGRYPPSPPPPESTCTIAKARTRPTRSAASSARRTASRVRCGLVLDADADESRFSRQALEHTCFQGAGQGAGERVGRTRCRHGRAPRDHARSDQPSTVQQPSPPCAPDLPPTSAVRLTLRGAIRVQKASPRNLHDGGVASRLGGASRIRPGLLRDQNRAGKPATVTSGATSRVTTAPAPTSAPAPTRRREDHRARAKCGAAFHSRRLNLQSASV